MMLNAVLKLFSGKAKALLLILAGSVTWAITIFKSGLLYSYGLGFWGANGHDGIWHLALIESLKKGSFEMPVFSGHSLMNYHIGFDLIIAILSKITFIPSNLLYFQIVPIFLSVLIGLVSYNFVLNWTKSASSAMWSLFFIYFGGSFGWILAKGESAFWSQQAVTTLINPPFALSLVFMLSGLVMLQSFNKKFNLGKLIVASVLFGTLIEVKAYAGVLTLGGLLAGGIYNLIKEKDKTILIVFFLAAIISVIVYLPLNKNSGDLLVFQPFWFLETLMGLADRLNFERYYMAMLAYKSGDNYLKLIPAYFFAFVIFWVGNMGTRVLQLGTVFRWIKNYRKLTWLEIFISTVILAGVFIPMLFLQKGTPWNTIQFFYYSIFLSAILAGISVSGLKNRYLLVILVLLTIPTTIITLKDVYIPGRAPARLPYSEIAALNFLSEQPDGVVLTKPFDENKSKAAVALPPRPLYLYESTAYVSAFSKKKTFMEDEVNLDITGYDWKNRRIEIENWYAQADNLKSRDFLKQNNISYIYWIKEGQSPLDLENLRLEILYENEMVTIYKVI